jgi:hypothetical protein
LPKIEAPDGRSAAISRDALEVLDRAVWVGRGGVKLKIPDMSTKHLKACLVMIEESEYGAECREAIELELEIRRMGLRGPFLTDTTAPEED